MKNILKAVTLLSLLFSYSGIHAGQVTLKVTAVVDGAFAYGDVFNGGSVSIGDTVTGYLTYDPDAQDQNPENTSVGSYDYIDAPYGWDVTINGVHFKTASFGNVGGTSIYNFSTYDSYSAMSLDVEPAPNGSHIFDITMNLTDDSATALDSDALPASPPTLADWDTRRFHITGLDFRIDAEVTNIELSELPQGEPSALTISPSDTTFLPNHAFDAALILPDASRWILDISATLNGFEDVSWLFFASCGPDYNASFNRNAWFCYSLSNYLSLQPGVNTLNITVTLDDFSTLQNSVQWEVLPSAPGTEMTVSTLGSTLWQFQNLEGALILPDATRTITYVNAMLNNYNDVSYAFLFCWPEDAAAIGRTALYCPYLYSDLYSQPGTNILDLTVTLDDGSTLQKQFQWESLR